MDNLSESIKRLGKVAPELKRDVLKAGRKLIDDPVVKAAQDNYRSEAVGAWKSHATKAIRPSSGVKGIGVKLRAAHFREAASLEFGALVHPVPQRSPKGFRYVAQGAMKRRLAPNWVGNQHTGSFDKSPGYVVGKAMKNNRREIFTRWQEETLGVIAKKLASG